jgi:hypothetical protein
MCACALASFFVVLLLRLLLLFVPEILLTLSETRLLHSVGWCGGGVYVCVAQAQVPLHARPSKSCTERGGYGTVLVLRHTCRFLVVGCYCSRE